MFTAGTGSANSEVWVQDATGGIAAYQIPTSTTGLAVGQRVSVRGQRQDVSGQEQIGSATTTGATITAIAGTGTVAPQLVTIQQAVARTGFEGELVTLSGFTVTATPTASAGADYTVNGTVAGTAFQLRVEGSTGIPASSFTAGTRYSVTGILTEFNGTSQIKPRSAADVAGPTPIATVRTQATGTTATVAGIVTAAPGSFTSASGGVNGVNSEVWVQDASGGIAVFPVPTTTTLALGDIVEVSGTLNPFAGQIQLSNNPSVTLLGTGTPVAPRRVTGAEFNARTYEGQLVTLTGVTVTSVPTGTSSAFNVIGTTPDGQTVVIRVTGPTTSGVIVQNTGLTRADFTVGQLYTLTGIATVNVNATTGVATVQLKPRMRSDVVVGVVATPANVIINEFMANPNLVADNAGEYIELHNAGGTDQNLQGWIISDNFGVDTIDVPLVIPAGGYVLLGVNADRALNGNIPVDFQYTSNIALGNSGDRIQLRDPSNVTVDSVAYTSNAQAGAGVAWGVVDAAVDNTLATGSSNWVAQTTLYNTADKGTPRARNDGQTGALRAAPGSTSGTTGKTGTTLGTKTKLTLRR